MEKSLFQRISFYQRWWRNRRALNSHYLDQEMARKVVNIEQEHGDRLIKIKKEVRPSI